MTFIDEIKLATATAVTEKERLELDARQAEIADQQTRQAMELDRYSLEGLKEEIHKAADQGRSQTSISVFSYQDRTPMWWEAVKAKLEALASHLEVGVHFEVSSLPSSGSDPLFDHTTYYGRAYLNWQ